VTERERCGGLEVVRCWLAALEPAALSAAGLVLPWGEPLRVEAREGRTTSYSGQGDGAVLTYRGGALYGRAELGRVEYRFECAGHGSVFVSELDPNAGGEGEEMEEEEEAEDLPHFGQKRLGQLMALGRADSSGIAEYTVTVYYTSGVADSTQDIQTFVEQVIAETNEGYANSGVPMRVKLHCLLRTQIPDRLDSKQTVRLLRHSQPDVDTVRRSADAAILLVQDYNRGRSCGVAYFDSIRSGRTFGTVRKGCALGYFRLPLTAPLALNLCRSFGHELAHGFGLAHDRRVSRRSSRSYAFGSIIKV
jgi:hypothetical protein